jgi:plastocyanin
MRVPALPLIVLATLLIVAACGGDDDEEVETLPTATVAEDTAPAPTPEVLPQPAPPQPLDEAASAPVDGVIAIEAREALFAPNRWAVSTGENVTIRVTNNDQQQHNLRLAGPDGAFDTDDDAITAPEALDAAAIGEVTFAPLVPGGYTFRCDFHPDSMGGQIEVEGPVP